MKALRSRDRLRGQLQESNQKGKPSVKTKCARFDTLVARYCPTVYSFAARLTDDPREAFVLTRDAFNSTRKHLRNRQVALASMLIAAVIRAGLTAT
jgi:hypothetical protein